ncbi:imidazole glycerol phosphate synthase subunit HisH [Litoribrevibacter albus]|uniref:Imidazole glycerol phosphate synthase subunit HisH n=1 Tax=Litoribrevibacter albus TaxID=1473156 RepID=A0AA37SFV9_9GAMM|nr:imidazole glycerol phosphate synthase subunit HisH [Litoribrevibacter albus]GLQ33531.1 imidazole glycerol phosphate synthase subunit HisH [Litoribrevibacter albus]
MSTIAIIDYGMGNLHSVASAFEHVCDSKIIVTSDVAEIEAADRVVFPGVGAIRDCMAEIRRLGMDEVVKKAVAEKPVLAICVGMQALMEHSEENGGVDCIGLLPGKVKFFGDKLKDEAGEKLKVPHMGWNQVKQLDHPLWNGIEDNRRFYFVHSFYVKAERSDEVKATCHYGLDFDVALSHGNLFAVQFHPEKSHTAGLQLLKNFASWDGKA